MASRDRPGAEPDPRSARPVPGQGNVPAAPTGPESWPAPRPGEAPAADPGPETGTWEPGSEDDLYGDGTATWDGPMTWQDGEQGGAWDQNGGAQGGAGSWEAGAPPTPYGAWGSGPALSDHPYGYQTGYMRPGDEVPTEYVDYGDPGFEPEWTGDDPGGGGGGGGRRPRRANGPWPELVMIAAVAVIIAAVILAVTSADRTNLANSQTSTNTTLARTPSRSTNGTGPSSSSPPRSSSTVPATTTTRPSTTSTAPANQQAKNLLVTPGVEGSLVRSWLATNPGGADLSAKDVAGTEPGQVYYAEQPASATYWALVAFKPSATLRAESSTATGRAKLTEFQNSIYAFSWQAGPVWTLLGEVNTGTCPNVVPSPVLKVWGMCGR